MFISVSKLWPATSADTRGRKSCMGCGRVLINQRGCGHVLWLSYFFSHTMWCIWNFFFQNSFKGMSKLLFYLFFMYFLSVAVFTLLHSC